MSGRRPEAEPFGTELAPGLPAAVSTASRAAATPTPQTLPRLQVALLFNRLLYTLLLPVGVALLIDLALGILPWLTLVTSLICIPLASLVVGKAVLRDLERVLAIVAPEPLPDDSAPELAAESEPPAGSTSASEATAGQVAGQTKEQT
ncbi:MAG: hypothetical protein ACRC1H_19645 [Caldilineaceae bacterium]